MARPMTPAEITSFLLDGTRTGKLAWVSKDGRPHVAPIWFLLDGPNPDSTDPANFEVVFMTSIESGKAKALTRTGRASMIVDMEEPPYAFVKIDGDVTLTIDDPQLLEWSTRIGGRYMGADRADEFGKRNATPEEALVRLTPDKVLALTDVSG